MEESRFATRLQNLAAGAISDLLKLTQQPDIISFAGGMPAPDAFPKEVLADLSRELLLNQGAELLQYGQSEGYRPLREWVAQRVARKGIHCTADEVLITTGSLQGIDLVGKAFLNPGDKAMVEAPTYLATILIFKTYEASFVAAPNGPDGLDLDALEELIVCEQPKLLYLIPNFQNPTGRTISLDQRRALADLLTRHSVALVEDDPYGELRYEGEHLPSLMGMDTTGQAIHLGSFSKLISPGLRVGYAIARSDVFKKLLLGKTAVDTHTSLLPQALVYEFCRRGHLDRHIPVISAAYDAKRRKMQQMIEQHMPKSIQWSNPEGGMFYWGVLPEGVDSKQLLAEAVQTKKVAFVPGESFFADGSGQNTLRLNFSNASLANIERGMQALAEVFRRHFA